MAADETSVNFVRHPLSEDELGVFGNLVCALWITPQKGKCNVDFPLFFSGEKIDFKIQPALESLVKLFDSMVSEQTFFFFF